MSFARKDKVRILRQESYWFNQIGEIVSIDKSPAMRYPVTVKFEKCDFKAFSGVDGGANTKGLYVHVVLRQLGIKSKYWAEDCKLLTHHSASDPPSE